MCRNRKFDLGEIVAEKNWGDTPIKMFVVVDYDDTPDARKYRVVPLDGRKRRRGDAKWMASYSLKTWEGEHSGTASIKTYRANAKLPDRGCECQCCIHEAYNSGFWTNTGGFRD